MLVRKRNRRKSSRKYPDQTGTRKRRDIMQPVEFNLEQIRTENEKNTSYLNN